jgi:MYXO-CTERM domain-containing protein
MKSVGKSWVAVLVTVLSATACQGAAVFVSNSSFEDQALSSGGWTDNTPPGWQEPVPNAGTSFTERIDGFASDGVNHEGIQTMSYIFQDLGVPAQPLTNYTLTAGVGNRNANFTTATNISRMSLLAGGETGQVIATADVNAFAVPVGTFADFIATGATGATPPAGNLFIRLEVASADRAHFDNIRLDATPVPEPTALGALVGLAALGLRRRRLSA